MYTVDMQVTVYLQSSYSYRNMIECVEHILSDNGIVVISVLFLSGVSAAVENLILENNELLATK